MSLDPHQLGLTLVVAAGLSTAIGAAVVFHKKLVVLTSSKILAFTLGGSSGVMLYVSLVEILQKSMHAFAEVHPTPKTLTIARSNSSVPWTTVSAGTLPTADLEVSTVTYHDENPHNGLAYILATVSFFAGVIFIRLLSVLVDLLDRDAHELTHQSIHRIGLERQLNAAESRTLDRGVVRFDGGESADRSGTDTGAASEIEMANVTLVSGDEEVRKKKLGQMGIMTALAIAIHNFPEGLATYVATVASPSMGMALALAIGIHNIPEGISVAIPIFYQTGNRWRAFWIGAFSGFTEPIGGLIGYAVFYNREMNGNVFGALFGMVAGIMVWICLHELLPMAHAHDPSDHHVSLGVMLGMIIMAASLCLFVT